MKRKIKLLYLGGGGGGGDRFMVFNATFNNISVMS